MAGVEVVQRALPVGDYACVHRWKDTECLDPVIIERKGISDLFRSFSSSYEAEKAKLEKATALGLAYVLAIEASATEVLKGHTYWSGGEVKESQKSGLVMIRQLFSLCRRHGVSLWFCSSRREMAWRIQEFYLSWERMDVPPRCTPETQTLFLR